MAHDEGGGRRPKRRCVTRKAAMPSAIHYVGYVEDAETPDMIMKKFEELERVLAAAKPAQSANAPHANAACNADEANCTSADELQQFDAAGASEPLPHAWLSTINGDGTSPDLTMDAACKDSASGRQHSGEQLSMQAEPIMVGGNLNLESTPTCQDSMLDEDQLMEIFKRTSIFNVRAALANNDTLIAGDVINDDNAAGVSGDEFLSGSDADEEDLEYLRGFWSDDEYLDADGRSKRRTASTAGRIAAVRIPGGSRDRHVRHHVVMQYNKDSNALIRRRVRVPGAEGSGLVHIRIPPAPIPAAWGRTVRPYEPPDMSDAAASSSAARAASSAGAAGAAAGGWAAGVAAAAGVGAAGSRQHGADAPGSSIMCQEAATDAAAAGTILEVPSLPAWLQSKKASKQFLAVLINSEWEQWGPTVDEQQLISRLKAVPLQRLCPRGFIFVWAQKGMIHPVTNHMYTSGYTYVENLTWVFLHANNTIVREPSHYSNRSHLTLLIFRREGEGKDIELRHQRNADVIFDTCRAQPGFPYEVPSEVYNIIETLLPTGSGAFLELWGSRGLRRAGWTHIVEVQPA